MNKQTNKKFFLIYTRHYFKNKPPQYIIFMKLITQRHIFIWFSPKKHHFLDALLPLFIVHVLLNSLHLHSITVMKGILFGRSLHLLSNENHGRFLLYLQNCIWTIKWMLLGAWLPYLTRFNATAQPLLKITMIISLSPTPVL